MTVMFKTCKGCPTPAKCKAAGKCMGKTRAKPKAKAKAKPKRGMY